MESKTNVETSVANKGWLVTIAGTCALLAMGVLYAWSVVKAAIPADWGWTASDKALPYSVACVVFSIMPMVGVKLMNRYGTRVVVSIGGVLAGLGVIISSQTTSLPVYILAFGFLLGTGIAFIYGTASPTALKWFPASKSGLISGIVVAGFGMGSAWVAPTTRAMIGTPEAPVFGLQTTLLILGIGMMVISVGFAQFMTMPPAGFVPAGSASAKAALKRVDFTPGETAKTWQFYFMWITFALGSGAGLMVIGNLASIVKDQIGLAAMSAVAVSVLAIGNGGGRVLYGVLSDKIGRKNVLLIAFIFQSVLMLALAFVVKGSGLDNIPLVMVLAALIGANYGANLAVFPVMTKDYFGLKNFAMNYGIVYTAWGLGGFMLSQVAGIIYDQNKTFTNAYFLAAGMLVVAAVMMYFLKSPQPAEETAKNVQSEPVAVRAK